MRWRVGLLVPALVAALVSSGCGVLGSSHEESLPYDPPSTVASAEPTTEAPPSPTAKPSPAHAKPKPKTTSATPTEDPNNFQLPACAKHSGKTVTKAQAKSALTAAAAKIYWPGSAPSLKVPLDLVKSVAWHESGWQADIVNCDGGRGLMQVMPDTASMINKRFGQNYDAGDYRQNAIIGTNYLAWLTRYFGDKYYKGSYDLSTSKCATHASMCLLNLVVSAYNAGFGAVDSGYAAKTLSNPAYVDSVRSLMTSCYCDRY